MKTKMNKYLIFGLAAGLFTLTSCSDDKSYDVEGNPNNLVYFNANLQNTLECYVVHTPVSEVGTVDAKFPVRILRPAAGTTNVTAIVDNSLISAYNAANNTDYVAVPDGLIEGGKLSVTIPQGEVDAKDSIEVSIPSSNFDKLTAKNYIIPIRLMDVQGDGKGSEDRGVGYVIINTESKAIQANVAPADMPGTLATDYSTWTARYSSGTVINPAEIFDGDVTNGPQIRVDGADGKTTTVIVDMQNTTNVTGVRLARYYKSYYGGWWIDAYYFSDVTLSCSTDGSTWTEMGKANDSEMERNSGYQYIALYGAFSMRYLKMEINSGGSNVSSLAELGVYTQN